MFYRFSSGTFIEAENFNEAKLKYLDLISKESEVKQQWYECCCLGLSHSFNCPVLKKRHEDGNIPF